MDILHLQRKSLYTSHALLSHFLAFFIDSTLRAQWNEDKEGENSEEEEAERQPYLKGLK